MEKIWWVFIGAIVFSAVVYFGTDVVEDKGVVFSAEGMNSCPVFPEVPISGDGEIYGEYNGQSLDQCSDSFDPFVYDSLILIKDSADFRAVSDCKAKGAAALAGNSCGPTCYEEDEINCSPDQASPQCTYSFDEEYGICMTTCTSHATGTAQTICTPLEPQADPEQGPGVGGVGVFERWFASGNIPPSGG